MSVVMGDWAKSSLDSNSTEMTVGYDPYFATSSGSVTWALGYPPVELQIGLVHIVPGARQMRVGAAEPAVPPGVTFVLHLCWPFQALGDS